ncbi:MAG: hypothetical protein FWD66_01025 [Paludibacter sp.]|nr:hypothetical protein [Paludibacter sp.]
MIINNKAKEFIENFRREKCYARETILEIAAIVEFAEAEMRKKATEAHCNVCEYLSEFNVCTRPYFKSSTCDRTCEYMNKFIELIY